jgi:glycosyltransferase involved in cell wall biosynthesis
MAANERYVISKWGTKQANLANCPSHYIEIGVDIDSWRLPTPEEREKLRAALGLGPNDFYVLTVADNHERKNLSAAVQALAKAKGDVNLFWTLVSRLEFRAGWNIHDLTAEYGISDVFMPYERGLAFQRLWALYAAADAFLLTSKAEGLCMPVLEAMASGTPVIATDCTAITEHLEDGRGFLIPSEYQTQDVWGNSWRHFIDTDLAAEALIKLANMDDDSKEEMITKARQYVINRHPDAAATLLDNHIRKYEDKKREHDKDEIKKAAAVAVL